MKVLIYGNGQQIGRSLFVSLVQTIDRSSDYIIAADGGAYSLAAHDVRPDIIIGDLDSFTDEAPAGVELIHDPDQETNDLQKALNKARELGADRVRLTGVSGDRMDHNLNNLSVLLEYSTSFHEIYLVDNWGTHFCVSGTGSGGATQAPAFEHDIVTGQTVSLYPLSGRVEGVRTEGLRYPLHGEVLEPGFRTGCLNDAVSERLRVWVRSGALLLSIAHSESY